MWESEIQWAEALRSQADVVTVNHKDAAALLEVIGPQHHHGTPTLKCWLIEYTGDHYNPVNPPDPTWLTRWKSTQRSALLKGGAAVKSLLLSPLHEYAFKSDVPSDPHPDSGEMNLLWLQTVQNRWTGKGEKA